MKVVVGLGNPGPRYSGTRHNVGFAVLDYLARGPNISRSPERFQAQIAEMTEDLCKVLLVKPQTFMNLSGQCVRQLVDFYQLPPEDLLIVCDDFNLPLGKLRIRSGGTHGGHNGLRDIQNHLGTTGYSRMRIGVDAPVEGEAVDHVLSRFRPGEKEIIEEGVARAAQAVVTWVSKGIEFSMNQYNG
ncbi:MAG TPA: aminoacyl-tRNA hydrolase [Gemmataceae bacterium]|jgi:PTH1 family peptidyl-tRNA hydrolase|nr:aminoacyl-tRNA hydrolase [Gemmataceae bacterium]